MTVLSWLSVPPDLLPIQIHDKSLWDAILPLENSTQVREINHRYINNQSTRHECFRGLQIKSTGNQKETSYKKSELVLWRRLYVSLDLQKGWIDPYWTVRWPRNKLIATSHWGCRLYSNSCHSPQPIKKHYLIYSHYSIITCNLTHMETEAQIGE